MAVTSHSLVLEKQV